MMKRALLLLAAATLASAHASAGSDFFITQCNLGCGGNASAGEQISCALVEVGSNQQLELTWNQPIDLSSISALSFQVVEVTTGLTQPGLLTLKNANTLRFTPAFGWNSSAPYQIYVPGTAQGDSGPFITSLDGTPNLARLLCTIVPSGLPLNVQSLCPAGANEVGAGACMTWAGLPSLSANNFTLGATGLPPQRPTNFLASSTQAFLPFGGGVLCLAPPIQRIGSATSDASGALSLPIDLVEVTSDLGLGPGQQILFQVIYRDPPAGNLSDALLANISP